jgi:hypothetical protein
VGAGVSFVTSFNHSEIDAMSPFAIRLRLEALETRCVLSTFTVTNTADSGDGSLRPFAKERTEDGVL